MVLARVLGDEQICIVTRSIAVPQKGHARAPSVVTQPHEFHGEASVFRAQKLNAVHTIRECTANKLGCIHVLARGTKPPHCVCVSLKHGRDANICERARSGSVVCPIPSFDVSWPVRYLNVCVIWDRNEAITSSSNPKDVWRTAAVAPRTRVHIVRAPVKGNLVRRDVDSGRLQQIDAQRPEFRCVDRIARDAVNCIEISSPLFALADAKTRQCKTREHLKWHEFTVDAPNLCVRWLAVCTR